MHIFKTLHTVCTFLCFRGRSSRVLWSREKVVSEQLGAEEDILSHLRLHFVCIDYSNFILI